MNSLFQKIYLYSCLPRLPTSAFKLNQLIFNSHFNGFFPLADTSTSIGGIKSLLS